MTETHWLPGIIGLGVGLVFAAAFLLFRRRDAKETRAVPASSDETLLGLERRAQSLISQLKELNADRHNLQEAQYLSEKARLEAAAAEALEATDRHATRGSASPVSPAKSSPRTATGFGAKHPQLVGAFWGMAVAGFFGVLAYVLTQESSERKGDQTITGRVPPGASSSPGDPASGKAPADPHAEAALQRLAQSPQDLDAMSQASHELIRTQRFDEADKIVDRGLAVDPFHPELRVHRAVLRATRGEFGPAKTELSRLSNIYPDAQEALLFLGAISMQMGDSETALTAFERFMGEAPPDTHPPQLEQAVLLLRQQKGSGAP